VLADDPLLTEPPPEPPEPPQQIAALVLTDGLILVGGETADKLIGGAGNDQIFGGGGDDILNGDAGNDLLDGGDGDDLLDGGAGDDTILFDAADHSFVDGGSGSDSLKFSGADETLDLISLSGTLYTGFEQIDLTGTGDNSLILNENSVVSMTDGANVLIVTGDAGDRVAADGFTDSTTDVTIEGQSYSVFNGNTTDATLLVDNDISASLA
jgi:Ca2+-binding RTX toxin-like protein